jgi:two-component system alkaline phosphatase synthesis response regulator PhoP
MALTSGKKILVVDDEPDVRYFLATCLKDAGFNVETAVDGIEALEKVETYEPDLMTLDMVMPRKSGIRVMRTLRSKEKWENLPVIIITAHAHDELGVDDVKQFNAFASGMRPRYMMEKPVTPEKLVTAICDILNVTPETNNTAIDEKEAIKNLINTTDPDTLKKIRDMLNSR